jgi:Ala-tRNA(Pro) deacylase
MIALRNIDAEPAMHRGDEIQEIHGIELRNHLGQDVYLANEEQVETLFADCEVGAVPALGAPYGLKAIVDDSLAAQPEIYLEGGDHESLVHISGRVFQELLADARQARFTSPGQI